MVALFLKYHITFLVSCSKIHNWANYSESWLVCSDYLPYKIAMFPYVKFLPFRNHWKEMTNACLVHGDTTLQNSKKLQENLHQWYKLSWNHQKLSFQSKLLVTMETMHLWTEKWKNWDFGLCRPVESCLCIWTPLLGKAKGTCFVAQNARYKYRKSQNELSHEIV